MKVNPTTFLLFSVYVKELEFQTKIGFFFFRFVQKMYWKAHFDVFIPDNVMGLHEIEKYSSIFHYKVYLKISCVYDQN